MGCYISGISLVYLRYLPGISVVYLKYKTGIFQVYFEFISGILHIYFRHNLSKYMGYLSYILDISSVYQVDLGYISSIFLAYLMTYLRYISSIYQVFLKYFLGISHQYISDISQACQRLNVRNFSN